MCLLELRSVFFDLYPYGRPANLWMETPTAHAPLGGAASLVVRLRWFPEDKELCAKSDLGTNKLRLWKWMERKAFGKQRQLWGGEIPHIHWALPCRGPEKTPEHPEGEVWAPGDLPSGSAPELWGSIRSWKHTLRSDVTTQGLPAGASVSRSTLVHTERGLETVSRGTSASACFYFKAWRQLKTNVWCQYFFSPHSSAILRNSWASGGGVWKRWNLFLRVATTYFSCGSLVVLFLGSAVRPMRLGWLMPWEHTHWTLWKGRRRTRSSGRQRGKSRTGVP